MFISDFRRDFYDRIKHERVLLFVSVDVDALCACKILQCLFECDHTQYTIVPVTGRRDLETAYLENSEQAKHVILINGGSTFSIIDALQPEEDVTFYILDSHRPVDVLNIYNDKQVILLMKEDDEEGIPAFDDLFRESDIEEDEEEESNDDDDGEEEEGEEVGDDDDVEARLQRGEEGVEGDTGSTSSPAAKKQRGRRRGRHQVREDELMKRRARRQWEEKRQQTLFDYSQFTYYGTASSMIAYELSWKLSRDTNDLLWWGILGVSEQYYRGSVEQDKYMQDCGALQSHVARLNVQPAAATAASAAHQHAALHSINCMKITCATELSLYLYRYWTVFESILHSEYTACQLKLWSVRGIKVLHEFLANIGLPLVEVKQVFSHMNSEVKDNIKSWIEQHSEKFGLDKIVYGSFSTQYGYRHRFSAMDMVLAVTALLDSHERCSDQRDNFLTALDSLSRSNVHLIYKGIELAKHQIKAILNTVSSFVNTQQILSSGPIFYAIIPDSNADSIHFTKPACLLHLARFLRNAQVAVMSNRKKSAKHAEKLPLILATPLNKEHETCIVVGIPPIIEESPKNFFGKAFEQAAESTRSRTIHDNFDTSIIEMKSEDLTKFIDALISLLS